MAVYLISIPPNLSSSGNKHLTWHTFTHIDTMHIASDKNNRKQASHALSSDIRRESSVRYLQHSAITKSAGHPGFTTLTLHFTIGLLWTRRCILLGSQ